MTKEPINDELIKNQTKMMTILRTIFVENTGRIFENVFRKKVLYNVNLGHSLDFLLTALFYLSGILMMSNTQ